jgi:hypothetical protein
MVSVAIDAGEYTLSSSVCHIHVLGAQPLHTGLHTIECRADTSKPSFAAGQFVHI